MWTHYIRSKYLRIPFLTKCKILWKRKGDRKCIIETKGIHDGDKRFVTQVNLLKRLPPKITLDQFNISKG